MRIRPGLVFRQQIKDAIKKIISRHDANEAARVLIEAAGFPYIGSLLWQSGLRHPTRGGLWLTSSYNSRARWEPAALPPPRPIFGHTATALSMATYFTLLAQGRLVNSSTSLEIKSALSTASWWRPKLGSGPLPDSAKIASKVGLLLLCTRRDPKNEKKCVASIATHVHEAGLIENGRFRYAVAITTVGIPEGVDVLTKLITEIDALIRANNP